MLFLKSGRQLTLEEARSKGTRESIGMFSRLHLKENIESMNMISLISLGIKRDPTCSFLAVWIRRLYFGI